MSTKSAIECPAAVRFLSLEPLLEDLGELDLRGVHWVIVGGESGPRSRGCDIAWIRSIVEQCRAANVACFVKQLGRRPFVMNGETAVAWPISDSKGAILGERPADLRVRQMPAEVSR